MEDIRKKQRALEVKRVWELVTRDPHLKRLASMAQDGSQTAEAGKIQVAMKDFKLALTKVFPSVSKRDENSYKALEGSLKKTRASITT